LANPVLFWLLARSIFEDGFELHWQHALALVAMEALGFWYLFGLREFASGPASQLFVAAAAGGVHQAVAIAFVIAALVSAYRGRVPDLIESRRRFRTLFVTVAGGYMVIVTLVEVFLRGAEPHPAASLLNAAMIFGIVFLVAASLLSLKLNLLLEPIRSPAAVAELDVAERDLLRRLDEALAKQTYVQEGLTIGRLAQQLGAQEDRLRQLINAKLGFRNFNDFLNHYRVQSACQRLADPSRVRVPVLTIAMNLGYGSIGPFNRAFKQATGCTPSEFRRRNFSPEADPIQL
jgi:AraC-like DNA-binding protein